MYLSLGPRSTRCFLVMLACAGLFYSYVCSRSFRESRFAVSGDIEGLVHATQLEPKNADDWTELGDLRLYRGNDAYASLDAFRRATELNPRAADAWMGTAYALQVLDQQNEERSAIGRALTAEPRKLEIIWQAANLYAVLGDRDSMMQQVCILLLHDRARAKEALELAHRSSLNAAGNVADCGPAEAVP